MSTPFAQAGSSTTSTNTAKIQTTFFLFIIITMPFQYLQTLKLLSICSQAYHRCNLYKYTIHNSNPFVYLFSSLSFCIFCQQKTRMGFGTAISCNALLKRRFAENVWQWRTLVSESDTHFQKLSLSPVCSVKNKFFTRKFVPSAQSLQALDMLKNIYAVLNSCF